MRLKETGFYTVGTALGAFLLGALFGVFVLQAPDLHQCPSGDEHLKTSWSEPAPLPTSTGLKVVQTRTCSRCNFEEIRVALELK
jgi:hypothetical protein